MCEAMFRLGTCAIAADQKPTLAETLPSRRVYRAGKSTNPNPALHISVIHLYCCDPLKAEHGLDNWVRNHGAGRGVEPQDPKIDRRIFKSPKYSSILLLTNNLERTNGENV